MTITDRRYSPRYKPAYPIAVHIGRGRGILIDISASGARIHHTGAIARGALVRVTFDWNGDRVEAMGFVLSSRVAGIGPDGTLFESRVQMSTALLEWSA